MMIATFRKGSRFTALFFATAAVLAVAGLTDAQHIERHIRRHVDPAGAGSAEWLRQRVSMDLTNGSFSDFLNAVSNETGLPVLQDAALAALPVQSARFTIKADNVPVRMLLAEALIPFELSAQPAAGGITIARSPRRAMRLMTDSDDGAGGEKEAHIVRIRKGDADGLRSGAIERQVGGEEPGKKVRIKAESVVRTEEDGRVTRELTLKYDDDGVASEGRLSIEIQK